MRKFIFICTYYYSAISYNLNKTLSEILLSLTFVRVFVCKCVAFLQRHKRLKKSLSLICHINYAIFIIRSGWIVCTCLFIINYGWVSTFIEQYKMYIYLDMWTSTGMAFNSFNSICSRKLLNWVINDLKNRVCILYIYYI